jgi:hypothetical protein
MSFIYRVTSDYDVCLQTTREWRRFESENYYCRKETCCKLDRSRFPEPIDVVIKALPKGKYLREGVFNSRADVYHVDFINQIRPYMEGFVFGKCFLADGSLVKDYVTCYSKDFIVIRGALGSKYIECAECGNVVDHPAKEPQYVLRRYLKGKKVYQSVTQCLFLDEELAMKLDFSPWVKTELEPIPICDKPVDRRRLLCDTETPDWEYDE